MGIAATEVEARGRIQKSPPRLVKKRGRAEWTDKQEPTAHLAWILRVLRREDYGFRSARQQAHMTSEVGNLVCRRWPSVTFTGISVMTDDRRGMYCIRQ